MIFPGMTWNLTTLESLFSPFYRLWSGQRENKEEQEPTWHDLHEAYSYPHGRFDSYEEGL